MATIKQIIELGTTTSPTSADYLVMQNIGTSATANILFTDFAKMFDKSVLGLVANSTAYAGSNTTLIQAALNNGGNVRLTTSGVIYFNDTLVIPTNTTLQMDDTVTLRATPNVPKYGNATYTLIKNANYNSTPLVVSSITSAIVTATPSGGNVLSTELATVTTVNPHGMSAGQYVLIKGDYTDVYSGIWLIDSTTTYTIKFVLVTDVGNGAANAPASAAPALTPWAVPSPNTGSMTASLADANIIIRGGLLDGDIGNGFNTWTGSSGHGIALNRTLNTLIENIKIYRCARYGICFTNCDSPVAKHIYFDTNADGIHVYGPTWNPLIEDITGQTGDDHVIFQTIDGAGYLINQGPDGGGSFWGGTIRDIHIRHARNSGCVVIYPNGGSGNAVPMGYQMLGGLLVENVSTENTLGSSALILASGYVTTSGFVERIVARNIRGGIGLSQAGGDQTTNTVYGAIQIDGWNNDNISGSNNYMYINYVTIGTLAIENMLMKNINSNTMIVPQSNAVIDLLSVTNSKVYGSNGSAYFINSTGASIKKIVLERCVAGASAGFFNNCTFAAAPDIDIVNCLGLTGCGIALGFSSQAATAHIVNLTWTGAPFNFWGGAAVNLYINNFHSLDGTTNLCLNWSANSSWYNPDGSAPARLDLISRTVGQIAKPYAAYGSIPSTALARCESSNGAGLWTTIAPYCSGTGTLAAGDVVITNNSIKAGSLVLSAITVPGGTPMATYCASISAGYGVDIRSVSALDTSTVAWSAWGTY